MHSGFQNKAVAVVRQTGYRGLAPELIPVKCSQFQCTQTLALANKISHLSTQLLNIYVTRCWTRPVDMMKV